MKTNRVNNWYNAFVQPTTFLGVLAIVIILGGAFFVKTEEYNRAYEDGIRRGADLTRVLEENVSHIFYSTDSQLLLFRQLYQREPKDFDLAHWINNSELGNTPAVQFAIVGSDGKVLSSSLPSTPPSTYVGDQDYFLAQIKSPADDLFIGAPAIDRTSNKATLQLSRRLTTADGLFGGVVFAWLDVPNLDKLYNSLDIGQDGIISLVGFDRIIRACGRNDGNFESGEYVDNAAPDSKLFELYHRSSSGYFWATSNALCKHDGIRRLVSYKALDGLHLFTVVGIAENEIFRRATENAQAGWSRALFFVGIILVAVSFAATRERRLIAAKSALSYQACHDALTGLANRQAFVDELGNTLSRLRTDNETFNVFMLDLDRFKEVNDSLGHPAGDALLKETARKLKSSLRDVDFLARFGGDEFAIVQRCDTKNHKKNKEQRDRQHEVAIGLAKKIICCFAAPFEIEGKRLNVSTSIGIAMAQDDNANSNVLVKRADFALYRAKAQGSNNYVFFDRKIAAQIEARQNLECELRKAISNDEFELHYQPIMDAKTEKTCSIEALVRWRHPKIGLISPREFMPAAEATGLIVPIGQWILQRACMDATAWPPNIKVVVNLSTLQFKKSNLVADVNCALLKSGLSARRLEVDITESAFSDDDGRNLQTLHQLKKLGVTIALDDFGSGYSSLKNLTMFPFDKIRIDGSFVSKMTKSPACATVIAAVITLGHCLELLTTAKGVESKQEFKSLRASGINLVQGFLFGPPRRASELHFDNSCSDEFIEDDDRAIGAI